jgi:hypothetical protein
LFPVNPAAVGRWGHESGKAGLDTYLQTKIVWPQM